jgi:hypothetical protein
MESSHRVPTPGEAAAAIAEADAGSASLANRVRVPRAFFVAIGIAIAVQIGTTAIGLAAAQDEHGIEFAAGEWPVWLLSGGVAFFVAVSAVQLARFRRLNGVWLGGLLSRVIGGTATAASVSYSAALGGATWAAFAEAWWLVPLAAIAGGAAYALSGLRWMRTYRGDPALHGRGESAAWLAVLTVLGVTCLVLLVALR